MTGPAPAEDDAAPKVTFSFAAPPERVFALLIDASGFPDWLVGAQRIRRVDTHWPAPGSGFDHTVGLGPARIRGRTTVVSLEPPWSVVLEAGMGWMGSFLVEFELRADGSSTILEVAERPHQGLIARLWGLGAAPVMRQLLWGRNHLSLEHLSDELAVAGRPVPD